MTEEEVFEAVKKGNPAVDAVIFSATERMGSDLLCLNCVSFSARIALTYSHKRLNEESLEKSVMQKK